jgi:hypothetical protein
MTHVVAEAERNSKSAVGSSMWLSAINKSMAGRLSLDCIKSDESEKIGIMDDFLNGCVSVTPLPSDWSIIK